MESGKRLRIAAIILAMFALPALAAAQDRRLTIGLATETTSVDPHYHLTNSPLNQHIFDRLLHQDARSKLTPALAVSWRTIDELTWEFKLRPGVKWHDGSPFTADDVIFTMQRAPTVPNSPAGYGPHILHIKEMSAPDDLTVVFKTATPYPLMLRDMSVVPIISRKHGTGATTPDYNTGKATIGTGPFKFVEWVQGSRLVLARNPDYWGGVAPWSEVVFRPIPRDAPRMSALLAGDVDVVDDVSPEFAETLKANPQVTLFESVSNRVVYLNMDFHRDQPPGVTDAAGNPLGRNPFRDLRVRQAILKAINRPLIRERIMLGRSVLAGQILPDGFDGVVPGLPIEEFDLEGARRLMAEAGYAQGFGVSLPAPSDRWVNSEKIVQAIAQQLSRINIRTKVETMPVAIFLPKAARLEFGFWLQSWGGTSGETISMLKTLLGTYDREKGIGAANRGRYSNPAFDALLAQILSTVDDDKRLALVHQATRLAMADLPIIPLHFQVYTWATRKGFTMIPRADESVLASEVRPAP